MDVYAVYIKNEVIGDPGVSCHKFSSSDYFLGKGLFEQIMK